jgi:hypothetical protein
MACLRPLAEMLASINHDQDLQQEVYRVWAAAMPVRDHRREM